MFTMVKYCMTIDDCSFQSSTRRDDDYEGLVDQELIFDEN